MKVVALWEACVQENEERLSYGRRYIATVGGITSLDGKFVTTSVIYQATVTRHDNMNLDTYIGLTCNSFKSRYSGHSSSFMNKKKRNGTTLSEHIWGLKEKNVMYSIMWKILSRVKPYHHLMKYATFV